MTDSDGCSGENSNDFHAYYYFMDCESSSVVLVCDRTSTISY